MKKALLVAALGLGVAVAAWAQPASVTTGPFRDTAMLERELHAGVTTPDDVRRLLGNPNGVGGLFGIIDDRPFSAWFYDDIEVLTVEADRGSGTVKINARQQFLMVFFRDGSYQGHMWFSNDSRGTAWVR